MRHDVGTTRSSGFTVIELIITITVLAILVTMGIPAIQELIKNNRVTSQTNELVALVNLARNESIRRNRCIVVELTSTAGGWNGVVKDTDPDEDPCTPTDTLRTADYESVLLATDTDDFAFNNRGYVDGFTRVDLALEHTNCSGDRQKREITILPTGQVSSSNAACPPP